MNATGLLSQIIPGEGAFVFVPFPNTDLLEKLQINEVGVTFDDGRTISHEQRKKIFALIDDIAVYIRGVAKKTTFYETLREMQMLYLIGSSDKEEARWKLTAYYCNLVNIDRFSLSDVDMTTAREFIDWLVEFCVIHGIPCMDTLLNRCEDIGRYLYACVANRRCAICGNKADIHEYDRVGMGRDRRKIHHLGQRVQPLCRKHHSELDQIGQQSFDQKHHLESIKLDENLCKILKWRI